MNNTVNSYLSKVRHSTQKNLLVVDDEQEILAALKRNFHQTHYKVFTASSAQECLDILENEDIQVLLSDFRMPEVDGGTLVKQVKLQYPDIVSMILTGYADFDAAVSVMNSGAAYKFLSKPWNNQELTNEVEQAFDEFTLRQADNNKHKPTVPNSKPERACFEQRLQALTKQQQPFAVASITLSEFAMYDPYWEQQDNARGPLSTINHTTRACLTDECEIFETDIDQLLVIIPTYQNAKMLHDGLSILQQALTNCYPASHSSHQQNCTLAYAISPFENISLVRLLHAFRQASCQQSIHSCDNNRGNIIKLDAPLIAQKQRIHTIQNSIQQAINCNQFSLFFQPKVRVDNGLVESAEVLMRWQHASLGWVSPVEFISLSELDGQIEKIGSWLFSNSVQQLKSLRKQYGQTLSLAINVSPRQLRSEKIVIELNDLINQTKIEPSSIELEITEGCVIEDFPQTTEILWQLKRLGVKIALDDFGSGYTSFSYLSKLPVDVLKLDKILIDDIENNLNAVSMLTSVIGLCKKLGIKIVAEGAENQKQVNILQQLGCDYIQGFVYSRPVTKAQFEKILINQPYKFSTADNEQQSSKSALELPKRY
jgi:EAL domain-containing protein (putative c-di-GMP-specific phosphodiesterase class I)/FixJ family two-component response regulator